MKNKTKSNLYILVSIAWIVFLGIILIYVPGGKILGDIVYCLFLLFPAFLITSIFFSYKSIQSKELSSNISPIINICIASVLLICFIQIFL